MARTLNFIDLFSGCGGLSVGLSKAGLNCVLGLDHRQHAIESFQINHKKSIGLCADIRKTNPDDVRKLINRTFKSTRKIHLICGGPPCQGFSTVGTGDANDERNHLFLDFVKFVEYFNPNYILIENVTGLLAKKNRDTLKSIYQCFNNLGYNLDVRVLSSNHYGVPEVRRRVIIIGNNQNAQNHFPAKEYANINEANSKLKKCRTVGWAFNNLIYHGQNAHNHDENDGKIKNSLEEQRIKHIKEGCSIRYERDEKAYLPKRLWFDHGIDENGKKITWEDISEKRFREAKLARLDRNKPSPTILTSKTVHYHPTKNRYLTVREAAALQSFPPDFIFKGTLSNQWTQIGNAVPPLMAEALGKSIIQTHKNKSIKIPAQKNIDFDAVASYAFKYDKDTFEHSSKLLQQMPLEI